MTPAPQSPSLPSAAPPPTILVTGSTDGIGHETARQLVQRGAQVIVHGRTAAKVEAVTAELTELGGRPQPAGVVFDLSNFGAIAEGAHALAQRLPRLDVLLHNAGIFDTAPHLDEAGLERTWKVNHLAPMLLTHALLPLLRSSAPARVVVVASVAHQRGQLHWDRQQQQLGYTAYAQSKLANVLFARSLSQQFDSQVLSAFSLHPGVVGTKLLRAGFGMSGSETLEEGAATSVYCALTPGLQRQSGRYFVRCQATEPAAIALSDAETQHLWQVSCAQLGLPEVW